VCRDGLTAPKKQSRFTVRFFFFKRKRPGNPVVFSATCIVMQRNIAGKTENRQAPDTVDLQGIEP